MARLEIVGGGHTGKCFDFTDEARLGRSPDNDFCLPDVRVSRYHARITRNGPHFILEDLHSLNGTSRRGTRLIPPTPCLLTSGDEFEIASMRIAFYEENPQEPPEGQTPLANTSEVFPSHTMKLDVEAMTSLPLHWIDDDIASASIVATRDAIPDLSLPNLSAPPADHQQTYRRLQAMCEISMKIGMIIDLPTLMPKILDWLFDIYPLAERASILLCTTNGAEPVPIAVKTRGGQSKPHKLASNSRKALKYLNLKKLKFGLSQE